MKKNVLQIGVVFVLSGVILLSLLLALNNAASAANLCVAPGGSGGCFATVQTAVNAANSGDTIQVVAGTYSENVTINKELTLLGGYDDTSLTSRTPRSSIIDGGGLNSVIKIFGGTTVTVDGFTITNGNGTPNNGQGGGIDIVEATAVIQDNLIENNVASYDPAVLGIGGGIHVISSTNTLIQENTIRHNIALSATHPITFHSGFGGGIGIGSEAISSVVITGNQILSNTAVYDLTSGPSLGNGGGIAAEAEEIIIEGNLIEGNRGNIIGQYGSGGGIALYNFTTAVINNNIVRQNTAIMTTTKNVNGGGILVFNAATLTVTNNTIEQNIGAYYASSSVHGGGIHISRFEEVTISGNRIISNTAGVIVSGTNNFASGGGINLPGQPGIDEIATIEDNIIAGNVAVETMIITGSSASFADGGGIASNTVSTTHIINNQIENNVTVRNFIINGNSDWGGRPSGGGIHINNSDTVLISGNDIRDNLTVEKQTIVDVDSGADGGGITLNNVAEATVEQNNILGNMTVFSATISSNSGDSFYASGGAIKLGCYDIPNCNSWLTSNVISDNVTAETISGSGSNVNYGADGLVTAAGSASSKSIVYMQRNLIANNIPFINGFSGPTLWVWSANLTSTNDVFAYNVGGAGAGAFSPPSNLNIVNGTFYENGWVGVQAWNSAYVTVTNTIIDGHDSGLRLDETGGTLVGDYNLLTNINNYAGGIIPGANDITNMDPDFVNAAGGDFHLNPGSPAVDQGNDTVAPIDDFEGDLRPFDGNFDGTSRTDIGADELGKTIFLPIIIR